MIINIEGDTVRYSDIAALKGKEVDLALKKNYYFQIKIYESRTNNRHGKLYGKP